MAKFRSLNTKFWDDTYIVNLDPIEKLLYLYFLTNPLTDLCGIYELPLRRISFDTGIDKDMVLKIINRFSDDEKIYYFDGWVVIKNFLKHQSMNSNMKKGVERTLENIPEKIWLEIANNETLCKAFESLSNHFALIPILIQNSTNTKPIPIQNGETDEVEEIESDVKEKQQGQILTEHFFRLKGWQTKERIEEEDPKTKKQLYAVYSRYKKTAEQILDLVEGDLKQAKLKVEKVQKWADSRELDWSLETLLKKWMDIDDLPQEVEKKKVAYIDGDRAYEKFGKWYVILHNGEHKEYIGSLDKIEWK